MQTPTFDKSESANPKQNLIASENVMNERFRSRKNGKGIDCDTFGLYLLSEWMKKICLHVCRLKQNFTEFR